MLRLFCTLLTVSSLAYAQTQHNQLSEQEKLAGWQLLFDGASTAGWEGFNDTPFPSQSWAIEDDALRTLSDSGGGDLVSVSQFENFELVFDWKLVPGGNSGVKYLVQKAWAGRDIGRFKLQLQSTDPYCMQQDLSISCLMTPP